MPSETEAVNKKDSDTVSGEEFVENILQVDSAEQKFESMKMVPWLKLELRERQGE